MTNQAQSATADPVSAQQTLFTIRIQAGVAWLDHHVTGWRDRITEPVSLDSPCQCILGQIFKHMANRMSPPSYSRSYSLTYQSGYEYAIQRRLSFAEAEAYGFTSRIWDGYELLTQLWCQELATPGSVVP